MQKGWIKIHRKLKHNPIWQDPHYLKLWMHCLMEATHKEREQFVGSDIVKLTPGQFVTGRISLAENLNNGMQPKKRQSESTWWRQLRKLEEWQILNIKSNNKYSVVTITNWESYQEINKERTEERTTDEQQMNSRWTADEQQMNTNKNVKNLRTKELKESTTTVENDAIVFYQNNIGLIRPIISEEILDWINDLGDELVIESLKRAIASNKANWGYAKAILRSWHQKGIKTIEQADAESVEFQNQQQSRFGKNTEPEIQPEWFKNRGNPVEDKPEVMSDQDRKEHDEVEAMLRKYS